jgi:hypothetical protein
MFLHILHLSGHERTSRMSSSHLAANPFLRVDIIKGVGASKIISCPDTSRGTHNANVLPSKEHVGGFKRSESFGWITKV